MSKIRELLNDEVIKVQERESSELTRKTGTQLTFDDYSILFLASIMEEERNECSGKKE